MDRVAAIHPVDLPAITSSSSSERSGPVESWEAAREQAASTLPSRETGTGMHLRRGQSNRNIVVRRKRPMAKSAVSYGGGTEMAGPG
jgi:hypothetical protein